MIFDTPKSAFATPVERFLVQNQHVRCLCIGFWSKMRNFYEKVTVCDACRAILGQHVHEKGLKTPLVSNTLPVNLKVFYNTEPPSLTLPPFLTTFVLRPQPDTTFNHAKACFPESAAVCNYLHTYAGVSGHLCKDTLFLKFHVQLPKGPCKET